MTACDLMQSPGWSKLEDDALESRRDLVRKLIRRVTMKPGSLGTEIDRSHRCRLLPGLVQPKREQDLVVASIECPISLKRRGVETPMVVTNAADRHRQNAAAAGT